MFCKNTQVSNIMKILPVEANFVTKLTVAFRNLVIAAMNSTAKLAHLLSIFPCLMCWKVPEVNSIKSTGVVWYVRCRKEGTMQVCLQVHWIRNAWIRQQTLAPVHGDMFAATLHLTLRRTEQWRLKTAEEASPIHYGLSLAAIVVNIRKMRLDQPYI